MARNMVKYYWKTVHTFVRVAFGDITDIVNRFSSSWLPPFWYFFFFFWRFMFLLIFLCFLELFLHGAGCGIPRESFWLHLCNKVPPWNLK
jgi:hypothetical protein